MIVRLIALVGLSLVALTSAPVLIGSRVASAQSTDDRDAQRLASLYNSGQLRAAVELGSTLVRSSSGNDNFRRFVLEVLMKAHNRLGQYEDVVKFGKQALAITADPPAVGAIWWRIATAYQWSGENVAGEDAYRRSLEANRRGRKNELNVAASLNNLGTFLAGLGRQEEAEQLLKQALALQEKVEGAASKSAVNSMNNLAMLYFRMGRLDEAQILATRARTRADESGSQYDYEAALKAEGLILQELGHFNEAEAALTKAYEVNLKRFGPEHLYTANSFGLLGNCLVKQKRYEEALQYLRRALAIWENTGRTANSQLGEILLAIGDAETGAGRLDKAEASYTRALGIRENVDTGLEVAEVLDRLAMLKLSANDVPHARQFARRAVQIASAAHAQAGGSDGAEQTKGLRKFTRSAVKTLAAPNTEPDAAEEAFVLSQWADQSEVALAMRRAVVRIAAGSGRLSQMVREQQDETTKRRSVDAALIAQMGQVPQQRNPGLEEKLRRQLQEIDQNLRELRGQIDREFPGYAGLMSPQGIGLRETREAMGSHEALLAFMVDEDQTYVWAVTKERAAWRRILINAASLREKLSALRVGLEIEDPAASTTPGKLFNLGLAHELYLELIAPVEDLIKDRDQLLIVPSGPLTGLPFHLLLTHRPTIEKPTSRELNAYRSASWLLRTHAVAIVPSISSLVALRRLPRREEQGSRKPLVGFADPLFDQRPSQPQDAGATRSRPTRAFASFWRGSSPDLDALKKGLSPLPATARELRAVANALGAPPADLHFGRNASKTILRQLDLKPYRVVYFATHGLVAGDVDGLAEPALVLSIPSVPDPSDNGVLTASEIALLNINADWVVLSACNTAAGDKPGAEALSGLARAFFYAGARSLLVSHWRVDSDAAARLAILTFDELQKDPLIGRAEALRRAMLDYLMDASSPWNSYPDFWGPFSIVGENGSAPDH